MFRGVAEHMGTIPACAGPTSHTQQIQAAVTDHPRVRGADDETTKVQDLSEGPSPRARGRRPRPCPGRDAYRTIPACAGPTRDSPVAIPAARDHPRVRGADIR